MSGSSIVEFIKVASENFWNIYTISLLLGTGFVLTVATKFIQIRKFVLGFKFTMLGAFRKDKSAKDKGDITPFQALMTSLASTVGNGNIAGVATALVSGGPGAIFWMWMTAIVGMATKYSEAVLAVHFRKVAEDGSMSGGPMYYIQKGLADRPFLGKIAKPLAIIFAVCGCWTTLFGTGNMVQSNSMALAFKEQVGLSPWITGIIITIFVGMVIIGGIKRIGKTAEILVPVMIFLYFGGALTILALHITKIPAALAWIFESAFSPQAAIGGGAGYAVKTAIQFGVRRGLLSNESGLGSTPIAHAASKAKNPVRQGLIAMFDTFIDTLVVCTITALTIIVTGAYSFESVEAGTQLTSTALTASAFNLGLHSSGGVIVAICSTLFGFSTLIGWYYYGERCFEFLFGLKKIMFYKVVYVCLIFCGAIMQGESFSIVWNLGDLSNGLMAAPNLVGLIFLSGLVYKITDEYVKGNKI